MDMENSIVEEKRSEIEERVEAASLAEAGRTLLRRVMDS